MKKILFTFLTLGLFLFLPFAGSVEAQTLEEKFETSYVTLPTSYSDGYFTNPTTNIKWTYGHSRNDDGFQINGQGLMLRRASDSYLEATFPNGVGEFTFQYKKAYTNNNTRILELNSRWHSSCNNS